MSNKSSKPVELLAHTVASCRDEITFTFSPALSFSNQESDYVSRPLLQRYQLRKCPYTVDEDQEGCRRCGKGCCHQVRNRHGQKGGEVAVQGEDQKGGSKGEATLGTEGGVQQ